MDDFLHSLGGEGDLPGGDLGAPPFNCAPFCALPKMIAVGGSGEGGQIACNGAAIQRNSNA